MKISYRGWPAHHCCAKNCYFHLNTLIEENEIKIIVSTVGLLMDGEKYVKIDTCNYFETMVFYSDNTEYNDPDVCRQIDLETKLVFPKRQELDELLACDFHDKVVGEIVVRITKKLLGAQK